ncbi:MAG: nitroreductase/quinone reductase family protein [Pseudonocardia sp.]|nr:nitroreductase/quinone reductase family protein [Pseudonocardia sp.]
MSSAALPVWLPLMNRLVIALGKLGVVTGPVHVLTIPGRSSGEPRTTPVSPLTLDGRHYAIAAIPQADWARNARAAGRGELSRGRRRTPVEIHEVQDPQVKRAVLGEFPTQVPGGVTFFVRLGLVERADPTRFPAAADGVISGRRASSASCCRGSTRSHRGRTTPRTAGTSPA